MENLNLDVVDFIINNDVKLLTLESKKGNRLTHKFDDDMYIIIKKNKEDSYNLEYGFMVKRGRTYQYDKWNTLTNRNKDYVLQHIKKYQNKLNIKKYELD